MSSSASGAVLKNSTSFFSSKKTIKTNTKNTTLKNTKKRMKPSSKAATAVLQTEHKGSLISSTSEWNALKEHVKDIEKTHLRDLLKDYNRCENLTLEHDGVYVDYARQRVTEETMEKLYALARASGV